MYHIILLICSGLLFSISSYADNGCHSIDDVLKRQDCLDNSTTPQVTTATSITDLPDDITLPEKRFEFLTKLRPFRFTSYEPVYLLPVAFTSKPNNDVFTDIGEVGYEKFEVKFQLSTRAKITDDILHQNGDLWVGYTQKSFWQLYNDASAPFRETNYKPEFWFSLETNFDVLGLTNRFIDIGITHESNGRGLTLSRSWNRAFVRFGLENENMALFVMPWVRVQVDSIDNNPEIEDYVGRGEIKMIYRRNNRIFAAVVRNNFDFRQNRGSYELNWVFPMAGNLKGMVQYFNGYGESLIDYDVRMSRLSIGLVVINWL